MRLLLALPLLLAAIPGTGASAAVPIVGRWLTVDGDAVIHVAPCGRMMCGQVERIVKVEPGAPQADVNNPNPAMRSHPIVGLAILSEFTDVGTDWRGRIYDPRSGRTYKSIVTREGSTLKVKGCIAFLCQVQVWHPAS